MQVFGRGHSGDFLEFAGVVVNWIEAQDFTDFGNGSGVFAEQLFGIGYLFLKECIVNGVSGLLFENGFYKDFLVGNVVEIQSSDWIYMDTNFYYVIGVKYGETQYLKAEDGLQNIVDMMDKNRSLF